MKLGAALPLVDAGIGGDPAAIRPGFLQALAQTALFYFTIGATCSLILLIALLNRHKRTLHDMLGGTVMVRRFPVPWTHESWSR